jgi:hypothetical protein
VGGRHWDWGAFINIRKADWNIRDGHQADQDVPRGQCAERGANETGVHWKLSL